MKKTLLYCLFSFFSLASIFAQDFQRHEFYISAGGGMQTFQYDLSVGSKKIGFGGFGGLGYSYYLAPALSINTGAEFSYFGASSAVDNIDMTQRPRTFDGKDSLYFRGQFYGISEQKSAFYLNIPLMLQYKTDHDIPIYVAAGAKIGFALTEGFTMSTDSLITTGYFPDYNTTLTAPTILGFGVWPGYKAKGSLNLGLSVTASVEAGLCWKINDVSMLYTGLYFDYGLNNLLIGSTSSMIEYNQESPQDFFVHSLVNSHVDEGGVAKPYVTKLSLMAAGIKLRYAFNSFPFVSSVKPRQGRTYYPVRSF